MEYTTDKIIIRTNQNNMRSGGFTDEARLVIKKIANGCYEISENQFLLSTQNGVFLSIRDKLPPRNTKWESLIPPIPQQQDLFIRTEAIAITQNNIIVLTSIYDNSKFIRNEIYAFAKSNPRKLLFKRVVGNPRTEYTKIAYVGGMALEIFSNKGSKMVSLDDGTGWREQK